MSSLDATFLAIEDSVNHMHIGSTGIFDGPAPAYDDVRALVASKLPLVPRYRQKVRTAPGYVGRPVWVDDPHFALDYHLRHTALPPAGGLDELRTLVGRVMSQQLDRHRPLWETWMVESLDHDRWALITKVHHCMVDGIAGTDLLGLVLDSRPEPDVDAPVDTWEPAAEPSTAALAWHSVSGLAGAPVRVARRAADALADPRRLVSRLVDTARGTTALGAVATPPPRSSLMGPIGPHRRVAWARTSLDEVKLVRRALGGTVNDVVLAAIAGGLRDLLEERGESVDGRTVRSLVPVSLRAADARGLLDNRVTAVFAELPVGVADPVARLDAVRAELDRVKGSHEADAADALTSLSDLSPPMLQALVTRVVVHNQRNVETVTTNVPGPQNPLYLCGRRMREAFPYVPLGGMRVGVAIWSYDGGIRFGVTGDWEAAPDVDVLATGIEHGMRDLVAAAGAGAPPDAAAAP